MYLYSINPIKLTCYKPIFISTSMLKKLDSTDRISAHSFWIMVHTLPLIYAPSIWMADKLNTFRILVRVNLIELLNNYKGVYGMISMNP